MTRLVSFGDSWTFGVGLSWEPGMTQEEYQTTKKDIDITNKYSFRGLLAKEFGLENINFAVGGSSNQRQLRYAHEFEFKSGDIVLWGITSTARNEIWNDRRKIYQSYFLQHARTCQEDTALDNKSDKTVSGDLCKHIKVTVKSFYSPDEEVRRLYHRIKHWNDYFKLKGIKVLWYDTLNHHNYESNPENMLYTDEKYRDLLSRLCKVNGFTRLDDKYHFSWSRGFRDCGRIEWLSENSLANPFSGHPTKKGHRQLADMVRPFVTSCLR